MKKVVPMLSPFVIGLSGGWFAECFLCWCSVMASPFAGSAERDILVFCGIGSLLSALQVLAFAIADVLFLTELDNAKRRTLFLVAQAGVAILLFAVSLSCAEQVIHHALGLA